MLVMRRFSACCAFGLGLTSLLATFGVSVAHAEAEPLVEESDSRKSYWTLALLGGAAIPLANYADDRELGLTAQATIAFTQQEWLRRSTPGRLLTVARDRFRE